MGNKSGHYTIMWNGRDHGATDVVGHRQPHQRSIFIQRRRGWVYGGFEMESSISRSFQKIKQGIPRSTAPN